MDAILFCFLWLELNYWNVDPKISIKKIRCHLVDLIVVTRYYPCQDLDYCVVTPGDFSHKDKHRWHSAWFLVPDGRAVKMRQYLWSVLRPPGKKKSISESHPCYYKWKYKRYWGGNSRIHIIFQNIAVPFPSHHPQENRKLSFEPPKWV